MTGITQHDEFNPTVEIVRRVGNVLALAHRMDPQCVNFSMNGIFACFTLKDDECTHHYSIKRVKKTFGLHIFHRWGLFGGDGLKEFS